MKLYFPDLAYTHLTCTTTGEFELLVLLESKDMKKMDCVVSATNGPRRLVDILSSFHYCTHMYTTKCTLQMNVPKYTTNERAQCSGDVLYVTTLSP